MLIGTTNLNTTLNLTYVLTDVVETLLLDMRSVTGSTAGNMKNLRREKITSNINNLIFLHYE